MMRQIFLLVIAGALCLASCSPAQLTPQVVQQTVLVVVTAGAQDTLTPQDSTPTPASLFSDTAAPTDQPALTPSRTPRPSPTALALVNIPIEGGDPNNMFFAELVFPYYKPAATSSLVFQVYAHSPMKATKDGEGILTVDFFIKDQYGTQVYYHQEKTAGYCAFGGGEPTCNVFDFKKNNYTWPNGPKMTSGKYTIFVNVTNSNQFVMFGQADFNVQVP